MRGRGEEGEGDGDACRNFMKTRAMSLNGREREYCIFVAVREVWLALNARRTRNPHALHSAEESFVALCTPHQACSSHAVPKHLFRF